MITAYVERKRIDEEAAINPENLVVTGDSAIDARNAKRIQDEIARLKKNQGRRLQRKQKAGEHIPAGEYYTQSETVCSVVCVICLQSLTGNQSLVLDSQMRELRPDRTYEYVSPLRFNS